MTAEQIVKTLTELGYEVFKDEASAQDVKSYNYVVYYYLKLRPGDKKIIYQIIEFVFVNEDKTGFNETKIIDELEKTGLTFSGDADYGKLKKVVDGEIVDTLTIRFSRPMRRVGICYAN